MKTKFIIFSLFVSIPCVGQKIHRKCGPKQYLNTRTYLQNESLNKLPFSAIVHIDIKGWGTATFINDSTLITAKHLTDKPRIRNINLYRNIYQDGLVKDLSVKLTRDDFEIQHVAEKKCDPHSISDDISYIRLRSTGMSKTATFYSGCLDTTNYTKLSLDSGSTVTLSGYPVDLAEEGINHTDILANKVTTFGELLFAKNCPMLGYKIFTCSGDSGAPLWILKNGKYYIIAIHHGGPEEGTIFEAEERNSAAIIR